MIVPTVIVNDPTTLLSKTPGNCLSVKVFLESDWCSARQRISAGSTSPPARSLAGTSVRFDFGAHPQAEPIWDCGAPTGFPGIPTCRCQLMFPQVYANRALIQQFSAGLR